MSDSELQDVLKSLDDFVEQEEQEEFNNELQSLDNLISKLEAAAQVKTPEPIVKWKKRDVDGNQIFERPKASRNLPNQAGPSRRKAPRVDAPDTDCEMVFAPETVVRLMPVEMPEKICGCSTVSLRVNPGKVVAVVTINEMKMAAPGLSCQSFLRMLDQRTFRFGRSGKISADSFQKSFFEWEAVRFEVENICKEESFICPACTPDMLAVSMDGNPKHYRFKHAARSLEEVFVEGSGPQPERLPKDPPARYTKRDWSLRCVGMECFSVKWSGAYQDGAGLTLGEEVEQCNAFLSRIAVTTKHMSKAGRTDMLTLMAMRWNQQKFKNVATSLCHRYQKTTKALQNQLQNLETMKLQMAVTESKLEDWSNDVKEWAEAAKTTTNSNDADALASRIEVLVANLDGSKGRARIRRKIRTEKGILTSVVESYNHSVDLKTKRKAFDIIMAIRRLQEENKIVVTEMDHHWKALKARADSLKELSCLLPNLPWSLSEEGLKGVQSIVFRKRQNIREMKTHTRACYLQVLSGAENINFLQSALSEDFDSDSDSEID
ncbi:hypothetical protein NQZ68_021792 [Dissostichus eleginoides]|nr:hypothetical protein NQZ68_021792 [Dissostichus eleginoides]